MNEPTFICRNCKLPVEPLFDPWGGQYGWHHPTIEREVNIDGADVMTYATFCPDDLGEAEPQTPRVYFYEDGLFRDQDGRILETGEEIADALAQIEARAKELERIHLVELDWHSQRNCE